MASSEAYLCLINREINYKRKRPEAQKHIVINCNPPLLLECDAVSGVQRGPQQVAALGVRLERRLGLVAADHAVVPLLTNHSSAQRVSSQSRLTWASSGRLVSTATLAARFSCGEMNSSGLRELPALATAGLGSRPDNTAIGGRLMYNNNLEDLKGSKYYMRSGPQTNKLC